MVRGSLTRRENQLAGEYFYGQRHDSDDPLLRRSDSQPENLLHPRKRALNKRSSLPNSRAAVRGCKHS